MDTPQVERILYFLFYFVYKQKWGFLNFNRQKAFKICTVSIKYPVVLLLPCEMIFV